MPAAARALTDDRWTAAARFLVNGVAVEALAEGALWIDDARALIVSDLHFEKGAAFARRGQLLPPYDTHATLARLAHLIETRAPDLVVSLGDSFHDAEGPARLDADLFARLRALVARHDWRWILGNHDPDLPATLGGRRSEEIALGALTLRHEPRAGAQAGEIAGHLHPCAKVAGLGMSVRRRCFAADAQRLVMPAFGAFAGGLNVRDNAFAPLFPQGLVAWVMSRGRVLPAGENRLLADA